MTNVPDHPPADELVLDARTLRGIAHPLRMRLLALLRRDGPSTATKLAERVGVSSASASFHLRTLATYGFIVEDEGPADRHGRERWWRAAHRGTRLEDIPSDPAARAAAIEFVGVVAAAHAQRMQSWVAAMDTAPAEWLQVGSLSDTTLDLTPARAQELLDRIEVLLADFQRHEPDRTLAPDEERVSFQWQLLPEPAAAPRGHR
ncbi:helix-turn-helix protein [Motilibacter rhizosphaerae]|uniref:Helix-turn-helix protein n=1 Tax=Motilibacter rhizosphaerae TaxID=598652 RepID=A0A4Q7N7E1_9ACTN|nr:winged helix-turn-helix domain-containing protein [Motilibacter rhizosphaerae]RZS77930.1 helix-turn-helix protein [Motilibacter rhizosphaerae]